MTSSLSLLKRRQMGNIWNIDNFSYPGEDTLGGWEDHYITDGASGECLPSYKAIPIGNPYGFMVCVKRKGCGNKTLDILQDPIDPSLWNGYHKYSADMYRPWRKTAIQHFDPLYYSDRRTPNQAVLIANDHLRLPMKYNATGITPIHTPSSRGTKFFEYGYSYTEDQPPYKYNVTREQQPYPVWKNEQEFHYPQEDTSLDHLDTVYNRNNRGW